MPNPWDEFKPAAAPATADPWAEFTEATEPPRSIADAAGTGRVPNLRAASAAASAGIPTLRQLAPGVFATWQGITGNPGPELEAERAGFQAIRDAPTMKDVDQAVWSNPVVTGLMYAPTGTPQTARVVTKPPRLAITPEAAKLKAEGVKGLTVGQMAPQSTLGVIERASADSPLGMGPQRKAAEQEFMRVAQNKGAAPGSTVPANPDVQTRLGEMLDAYEPVYGTVKNTPIPPSVVQSLPGAASMPGRGVDARTVAGVREEVENALTVLGKGFGRPPGAAGGHSHGAAPSGPPPLLDAYGRPLPPAPTPVPKATAGDLMKVRSVIREEARAARQAQDFDRLRLLDGAEDVVTDALQKALPADKAKLLADADRQYARLMTAASAPTAGNVEFTPAQYLRAVERSSGKRAFKSGEAGDLQDLGQAAKATFENLPMTGVRPGILASLPFATKLGAPVARLANTDAGRRFLLEPRTKTVNPRPPETFLHLPGQAVISPEVQALLDALRKRRLPVGLPSAVGEEEQ